MSWRIFLIFLLVDFVNAGFQQKYEGILKEILESYNKKAIPRPTTEEPVMLDLGFYFGGINEVNELEEKFVTTGYLKVSWVDDRLSWSVANYTNIERIYIPQGDIWKPDVVLKNGFSKFSEMGGDFYYTEVESHGRIVWLPYDVFETRCVLDTRFFPFDRQQCNITFVVWSHSVDDVRIEKSEAGITLEPGSKRHAVWEIEQVDHAIELEKRESRITFIFYIKRKPTYYVINIILPVVLLGFLNCLVFVIPAESGEKIGFSVTVILAMVVFLTIVNDNLPTSSEYTCILACYMLAHVIFDVLILLLTTVQLRLSHRGDGHPMNQTFVKLAKLSRRKSKIACANNLAVEEKMFAEGREESKEVDRKSPNPWAAVVTANNKTALVESKQAKEIKDTTMGIKEESALSWAEVVAGIDFLAFCCSLLTYFIVIILYFIIVTIQY